MRRCDNCKFGCMGTLIVFPVCLVVCLFAICPPEGRGDYWLPPFKSLLRTVAAMPWSWGEGRLQSLGILEGAGSDIAEFFDKNS